MRRTYDTTYSQNVSQAVPKLKKYSYPDRLKMIGITSLKERGVRGDMIEVYKLLTGKEQIDSRQFFTLAQPHYSLRGHEKKLVKERSRLDRLQGNISSAREWSMDGTISQQKLWTLDRLTASRTSMIVYAATIWTSQADQLPVHQPTSTIK